MSGSNRGFMAKAATAFKYFFTGDDELFSQASSTAKRIPLEDPDMVAGGTGASADADEYVRKLCRIMTDNM